MKQCPVCQRTYTDDALSFCLEDGTQLRSVGTGSVAPPPFDQNYDPNKTLAFNSRDTSPPPANVQPVAPVRQPSVPPPSWSPTPSYTPPLSVQPARKSGKTLIIVAIAAVLVLGIGIVVLLTVIGNNSATSNTNANNSNRTVVNTNSNNANNTNNTNRSTTTASVLKDDFSTENWPTGANAFNSFYQNGEYHMQGKPDIYIYMFPQNSNSYATKDASVKVTARSVDGVTPEHGYGLVIHGKVNQNKHLEGYGFLLYTSSAPKYEIVRFTDGVVTPIVAWETSSVIRGGTSTNRIEVRTQGSQLSLYINGQFIKSITDTAGITEGIVGLYTTDTNEVAFDDMEIDKL